MAKILVCLLGFPLNAVSPLKMSLHYLERLRQLNIKTVVGIETSKDRQLKELIQLLKDEIEGVAALTRAKSLLTPEKFESIFRLCQYSGTAMTKAMYEKALSNLPVSRATLSLLSYLQKNEIPIVTLDTERMQSMIKNIVKSIKYLEKSGGVLWVADLRRHHVNRLAAYLIKYFAEHSIPGLEIEIVTAKTPVKSEDERFFEEVSELEFMKYDPPEVNMKSKHLSNIDLTASIHEATGAYYCTELDTLLNTFIQSHLKASQARVIDLKTKRMILKDSFKREPVLQRILADLNNISRPHLQSEEESFPSPLLSWEELKHWCHLQRENLFK